MTALLGSLAALTMSCRRPSSPLRRADAAVPTEARRVAADAMRGGAARTDAATPPPRKPASIDAGDRQGDAGAPPLRFDNLVDLGVAKSLVAIPTGVLLRTKIDELIFRPFERPKRETDAAVVDEEFLSVLPAPVIARGSRAYWISKGRLVRRTFREEAGKVLIAPLEELMPDAYDATRAAVWTVNTLQARDLVAYIARPTVPHGDRQARLWVEGGEEREWTGGQAYDLSDEAAGASSVALTGDDGRVWAVSLDARAAMCPVHVSAIELSDRGPPQMSTDVVVFVGEPQPSHTEIAATLVEDEPLALVPLPRYSGGFGLAVVSFGRDPTLDSPASWTPYPNGLDRALTIVFEACEHKWVAYVRPREVAPGADRVLVVAPLENRGTSLGQETVVGEARRFLSLTFAAAEGVDHGRKPKAGWLAWSADGNAWARALRCP